MNPPIFPQPPDPFENEQVTESQESSLLKQLLEDKDPVFRAKVLDIVVKTGLKPNDPLFLVLSAVGNLQVLLEEAPSALKLALDQVEQDQIAQNIQKKTQNLIAETAKELIQKTEALQLTRPSKILIPGLSLFTIVFSLGWLSGIACHAAWKYWNSSGIRLASMAEASLLQWAKSSEGKYAKQLWEWNSAYLNSGYCQQDMKDLQVTLSIGQKKATGGFCALWVVPSAQREFK